MTQVTLQQAIELAIRHHQAGRVGEAEQIYRQILAVHPRELTSLHNLAVIAHRSGQYEQSASLLRQALGMKPDWGDAYINLTIALTGLGKLDEAIAAGRQAVRLLPESDGAHNVLGSALRLKGKSDESATAFRRGAELNPNSPEVLNNLCIALTEIGQFDEAVSIARQAVAIRPGHAMAHNTLGFALHRTWQCDEAIKSYHRSLAIDPHSAHVHWNLAILLLSTGRLIEGWEEFEWRTKFFTHLDRHFSKPQWNGENLTGKTLLLHAEGGHGDALQFIRYVPLLDKPAAKMFLECHPRLVRLFSPLPNIDKIIPRGEALPHFDYHISLQSLPRYFKTDLTNIPNRVPYLTVLPEWRSKWQDKFPSDGRLRIGLAWAGSSGAGMELDGRTRTLNIFAPLAETANVQFYSLQKGTEGKQQRPDKLKGIIDFTDDMDDFADTASVVDNLDLIISVDTSIAHLAGALGKPTWILIPYLSDFRWLLERGDSPWYPTMRLFRQRRRNDWDSVIMEMAAALKELVNVNSVEGIWESPELRQDRQDAKNAKEMPFIFSSWRPWRLGDLGANTYTAYAELTLVATGLLP